MPAAARADVVFAQDQAEADVGVKLMGRVQSVAWCRGLNWFDKEALLDRPLPGHGPSTQRAGRLRDSERKWRMRVGRLVNGWQPGIRDREFREVVKGPPLPPRWNAYIEVPFGLRVGNPSPLRLYGKYLCRWPLGHGLREANPIAYAMWCVCYTLFAQDAAREVLDGLDNGRLWFLPPALIAGMRQVSLSALAGGDRAIAYRLD